MGRPGSGRARNASMSFPRSATTVSPVEPNMSDRDTRFRVASKSRLYALDLGARRHSSPKTTGASGSSNEERRKPGLDVIGDLVSGAIFGVAESALPREALVGARHVIGHPGEGRAGHDRFVRGDLNQVELRVDAEVLCGRQPRVLVDEQRGTARVEAKHQAVGGRHAGGVAVKLESERVADFHPD